MLNLGAEPPHYGLFGGGGAVEDMIDVLNNKSTEAAVTGATTLSGAGGVAVIIAAEHFDVRPHFLDFICCKSATHGRMRLASET